MNNNKKIKVTQLLYIYKNLVPMSWKDNLLLLWFLIPLVEVSKYINDDVFYFLFLSFYLFMQLLL